MLQNVSQLGALSILFAVIVIGEIVARITKGKVPSALVISFIMFAGFWTIFPKDLGARTGLTGVLYTFAAMILVTNMGTLINKREMVAQWQTVLINLLGLAGIVGAVMTLGALIFGTQAAAAATPPLTGGIVATMLMQQVETANNLESALVVTLLAFVMQGLVGYPLTGFFLGKESKRLLKLHSEGKLGAAAGGGAAEEPELTVLPFLQKHRSPALIILELVIMAFLAYWTEKLNKMFFPKFAISMYVWCLVYGFIGCNLRIVETDALNKANSYGFVINVLLVNVFASMNSATPQLFMSAFGKVLGILVISSAGMALMALVSSKIFRKVSFPMCYSIILTAYYGFPLSVILTEEAVQGATDNKEEQAILRSQILPKMLVGGFTSVTTVSVIIAGFFVNLL